MPSLNQPIHNPNLALLPDDLQREALYNKVRARPAACIRLSALVVFIAVLNAGGSGLGR